ncbi:exodeoxyribonuclease VII small subunit [Caldalkalibacillus salinus]|uniref:exodeoxyribonuclease VII small subunit n=1 Tax=Caldalkalibacillus salinus TaxID=2803787 RepID=UPI0019209DF0|nr:exodeoxyribonuclease VII small subunit [Caldalkalibacillus salinus]
MSEQDAVNTNNVNVDDSENSQSNVGQTEKSFEEEMAQLEHIVQQLETGEVPLEKAIELFQEGMSLSKNCHQKLEKVEKQVHVLLEEDGQLTKRELKLEEDR